MVDIVEIMDMVVCGGRGGRSFKMFKISEYRQCDILDNVNIVGSINMMTVGHFEVATRHH